jgi:hypothetical protein
LGAAAAAGVFAFADGELVLEPGQSVTGPMWLHLLEAGRFDFQCIWFCEPQVSLCILTRCCITVSSIQSFAGVAAVALAQHLQHNDRE